MDQSSLRRLYNSRLLRNTFWGSGGNGLMAMVSFAASIFVLRNLGPSEFGLLQEMTAYFLLIQNFENIVNPHLFKKAILEDPTRSHELVMTYGLIIALLGAATTLIALAVCFIMGMGVRYLVLAVLLSSTIFRFSNGIAFYFDSQLQTVKGQISINVGNAVSNGFKVLLSFLSPFAIWQAVAMPIQYFITMLVHFAQYFPSIPKGQRLRFAFPETLRMAVISWPLFVSGFVDIFKTRFPIMYLGAIVSEQQVGLFSAGVRLVEPWIFIVSALGISFWPKMVKSKSLSKDEHQNAMLVFFGAMFYLFLPIGLAGFFLSDYLVVPVLGTRYAESLPVLKLQSIALVFQALALALSLVEINENLAHWSLVRNILTMLVMVVLTPLMVSQYGIVGAAAAVLITNVISVGILPFMYSKSRRIGRAIWSSAYSGPKLVIRHLS